MDLLDYIFSAIVVVLVGIILLILGSALWTSTHCVRWEKQLVHHSAWTQFIWSGKVMIPIYHSAYSSIDNVCMETK